MKKILFIILTLFTSSRVFSQTVPTTPPPANPQQMNTNTVYQDALTKKYYTYNGSVFQWRQLVDSIQAARMIANAGFGMGTVTSIIPGIGFLSHTPITTTGTLNVDTALIGTMFAKLNGGNTFNGNQNVNGNITTNDLSINGTLFFGLTSITNGAESTNFATQKRNDFSFVHFNGTTTTALMNISGPGHGSDNPYIQTFAPLVIKPTGTSKFQPTSGKYLIVSESFGTGAFGLDTTSINMFVDTSSTNQRPYGTFYNKNSWNSLGDFATPTATVSVVSNVLSFSGGTSDFTKTLNLSSYTMVDKQVIVVAGRPGATTSSFGATTGSGSPAMAIFNRTGTSGTIELYVGSSTLVATSPALTFSAGDRIVITLERDGTYLKATAYNQTTRSTNVVAYYNYNTTITSNPLLPRTGQVGVVSYSGAFTVDSIRYATSAIKNAQIAVMGTSKSQYYDVSDVSRGYVTIVGSKYGNVLQHSGQSDATAQALLSLPELIALKPKIVLDEMECNDVRLGVPIATTMTNVRNYTAQLNAAGITVYHLLPFYEKIGTGGAVNLQPMVDSLKAAFPTTYIDTYTPTYNCASCVAADGVHVTDEGNSVIGNTIINFFNDKIKPGKNINQSFQAFKGITTQSVIINDNITSVSTAGTNYLNSLVNAYPTGNAFTSFSVGQNSTTQYLGMTYENSTFVTSGVNQPNTGYLVTGPGATGGIVLSATGNAPIKFATNGLFRGVISNAGNFLFGTVTDASTGVIQATGNVAVTGNINATTFGAINSTATITSTGNAINNFSAINSGTASALFLKGRVNNVDVFGQGWDLSANEVYSGAIDSRIYALRTNNVDRLQLSSTGIPTFTALNTAGAVITNGAGTMSISTALPAGFGGTGLSTYTVGDLLYASGSGTLSKLAAVASGNVLHSTAIGGAPAYSKVTSSDIDGTVVSTASLLTSAPVILATVTGINAKTTGTTAVYTVPTGKTAVVTGFIVRCTAASAISSGPTVSVTSTTGTVYASTALGGLTAANTTFSYGNGISVSPIAADVINFVIGTAATGTSQTVEVSIIGYLR